MEDTAKYLIHADVAAEGVVERSDVVGAIFGQTEGLLGDELDLRDLRQSQKVGRIDVEIDSANGRSEGHVTIASGLDKVETATLAASLETITRVGPCRADLEVREIEDVRAAKRREVVERAKELLRTGFDDSVMSSEEILAAVREHVRVEDVTEYEGLPAGPRVTDSDAIIVVEGRADVLTLLKYGVKNAIAVEGTNVPEAVADLTTRRTVTAFLDGDRGGDLILEELAQVGDVDYVAFAPSGSSVEDLDHHELFTALREKVPYDTVSESNAPREAVAATDGSATPAPAPADDGGTSSDEVGGPNSDPGTAAPDAPAPDDGTAASMSRSASSSGAEPSSTPDDPAEAERAAEVERAAEAETATGTETTSEADTEDVPPKPSPQTIYDHGTAIIREETDRARLLDDDGEIIAECSAGEIADALDSTDERAHSLVLDDVLGQQLVDVAADAGLERIIARELGQFTKRPTAVHIAAIDDVAETAPDSA